MIAHVGVLTVTTMIMSADGKTTFNGGRREAGVAARMLAETVDGLDDAARFACRLPLPDRYLTTVAGGQNPCLLRYHCGTSYTERHAMIDLYYWPTPNGHKIAIMLEECGLEYETIPVDIGAGEQFEPSFLKISPNNRIPAIVDRETGLSLFEGGAILLYLAEKAGKLLAEGQRERLEVMQWLFWQAANLGPMAGQLSHFVSYTKEDVPYAHDRYANEYDRLLAVMDLRLRNREFLAGDYSIADIASFPWILPYRRLGNDLERFPNLRRWFDTLKERPAVRRGIDLGRAWHRSLASEDKARSVMFRQNAATVFAAAQDLELDP
jgi:GST-like protein